MMLNLLAFLIFLGLSSVNAECTRKGTPCLDYTVLETHEGYEEREYPPIVWASASAEAKNKMDVSRSLIMMLYSYLAGNNSRSEKLQMMVPVRTMKAINGETNNYTMSIALTAKQSENPPMPANRNVILTREPTTVYVVRAFDGLVQQDNIWDHHADELKKFTNGDVDTSFYYMSVYDSPFQKDDRLNEVWMVKRPE